MLVFLIPQLLKFHNQLRLRNLQCSQFSNLLPHQFFLFFFYFLYLLWAVLPIFLLFVYFIFFTTNCVLWQLFIILFVVDDVSSFKNLASNLLFPYSSYLLFMGFPCQVIPLFACCLFIFSFPFLSFLLQPFILLHGIYFS